MELFNLLQNKSKSFYFFLAGLGLINSIWASALLIFINNKISGTPLPFADQYDWLIYSIIICFSFIVAKYFQGYMIRLTYDLGNDLGLSIFDKLRFSNYQEFLNLGEEKVRTAMADVVILQRFPTTFIDAFNAAIMVFIGMIYLLVEHTYGAILLTVLIIFLGSIYYVRNISIQKDLDVVRDLANVYYKNVNDFLRGFKQIKMDINRNDIIYHKYLSENRRVVKELTVKTLKKQLLNELLGTYAGYFVIGLVLFVIPLILTTLDRDKNITFLVTLLYIMGPISALVVQIHEFTKMKVSTERVKEFIKVLSTSEGIDIKHGEDLQAGKPFDKLQFKNIVYEYYDDKKSEIFRLQPLNLEIKKGEVIFVTGGNGSGKSTFINLLTGLYVPKSGDIIYNGQQVTAVNCPSYRNKISAIFADNYLFHENYNGFELNNMNEKFYSLIDKMGLTDIIRIDNTNKVSTSLSTGQQKRLALIYCLMENKDIMVLDEWAAEQDPVFKDIFYKRLIPEFKKMGKTIIVVTHDDHYFDCAERVLQFNYGRITNDIKINQDLLVNA